MWVFDGEEWTQDNGSEPSSVKPDSTRQRYNELMPELQVIEIVPLPRPPLPVPPLPLP